MIPDHATAAIELAGLSLQYDNRWIFRDFSLRVQPGEKVTLAGPSGAGKSTVLKCILGFVVPQQGYIRVLGQPVDAHTIWEIRRRLAYVAQEPNLGGGTVIEVVRRPFEYKVNQPKRDNLKRIPALMARFKLPEILLHKDMGTLSGGEKQRIALVAAILLERPILLLDEASSALDAANKQIMVDFLRAADDLTVLAVSHDSEWTGFSSRVVTMAATGSQTQADA